MGGYSESEYGSPSNVDCHDMCKYCWLSTAVGWWVFRIGICKSTKNTLTLKPLKTQRLNILKVTAVVYAINAQTKNRAQRAKSVRIVNCLGAKMLEVLYS